jgi:hypothetical protein
MRRHDLFTRRAAYGTLMVACAVVTTIALGEGARSHADRGHRGNALLLFACAVMAAICGGLSWMMYKGDQD